MSLLRHTATMTALGLASAGLVGVASQPAAAAGGDYELQWGVSRYMNEHLASQSFANGASESADGIVTFTGGVAGADSVQYQGSARYAFANPVTGVELYSLTYSDPKITVDADGDGTIVADVDWTSPGGPGEVDDATLTTFSSTEDDWADGALTATPDWTGVAAADTYGAGKPVNGASWAVAFVSQVPTSLNPFFYASGSANDDKKAPAAFTAEFSDTAVVADPNVTTSVTYGKSGVSVAVQGSGFTATDGNPGDDGVYAGLAAGSTMPDVDSEEDMDNFAAATWVPGSSLGAGTFSQTLTAQAKLLNPQQKYSVFTWRAHSHSSTSQDTVTPVTINWAKLAGKTTLTTKVSKKPTPRKAGTLTVTVAGSSTKATGSVKVVLTKGAATKTVRGTVKQGKVTVKLPTLAKGTWKVTTSYTPTVAVYKKAARSVSVKVG